MCACAREFKLIKRYLQRLYISRNILHKNKNTRMLLNINTKGRTVHIFYWDYVNIILYYNITILQYYNISILQ